MTPVAVFKPFKGEILWDNYDYPPRDPFLRFLALTLAAPRGIGVTLNTKGGGENHPTKWIVFTK